MYNNFLNYLNQLQESKIRPGLERMEEACRLLGNPERGFRSIHIAGTNGKGSTAAFLESIVRNNGYKVGLYTSPHLLSPRERIQIDREQISENSISSIAMHVREVCSNIELSYFEFLTLISFLYFADQKVDIAIVEVGLGGRWDATNVIEPLLVVMTPISIDHINYLGGDIESIAREKCGVVKLKSECHREEESVQRSMSFPRKRESSAAELAGSPIKSGMTCALKQATVVISSKQLSKVYQIIKEKCSKVGARLVNVDVVANDLKSSLSGSHQLENAALAVRAAEELNNLGYDIKDPKEYLNVNWPGRLQKISDDPEIILDGAHNEAGCRVLVEYLKDEYSGREIVFVFSVMLDKRAEGMISILKEVAAGWIFCEMENKRAASFDSVAAMIGDKDIVRAIHPADAVNRALDLGCKNPLIVVTGSLYLVGLFSRWSMVDGR